MPRHARIVVPGLPLHVVQRGNNRMTCFAEERDFLVYLAVLREALRKNRCLLHAYCLMSNHVHLLLTPHGEGSCASLMREVGQRYAHYYNSRYERTGTLWEGRFRSCIVESTAYVLACYRYIELNPVRAGMVPDPAAYRWSSFRGNSGEGADPLLVPHDDFRAISRSEYLALVAAGIDESLLEQIRSATGGGYPLVTEALKSELATSTGRPVRPGKPGPKGADKNKSEPVPDLFSGGAAS